MKSGLRNLRLKYSSTGYTLHRNNDKLQRSIIIIALFNLFIVSVVGLVLRAYPLYAIYIPSYKNLLHAHSHFAFGGWVMPVLLAIIVKYFPRIADRVAYPHLKHISSLLFISSYGMLLSFPIQGYAFISIFFSSLSILAGFYQAFILWQASAQYKNQTAVRYLRAGLIYLTISSIGPLATGPLIATGNAGTPLYFNSIYFFLHFQYNGWFTFAILGVLYQIIKPGTGESKTAFSLMNISCMPAYFLSTLWSHPGTVFNLIGGLAGVLQIIAAWLIVQDIVRRKPRTGFRNGLIPSAFLFFVFKIILQFISSFNAVAEIAYQQRNFTIAYLHLVLLGFVTTFIFGAIIKGYGVTGDSKLKTGILFFLAGFLLTETLLIINACGYNMTLGSLRFQESIFIASLLLPVGIIVMWWVVKKKLSIPIRLPRLNKKTIKRGRERLPNNRKKQKQNVL